MKLYLALAALLFSGISHSQNYSKVKIYADYEGLGTLTELGLAVDHGIYKENTFIISDFSDVEIQLLIENGFQYEILIEDVKTYYLERNEFPVAAKNTSCSASQGHLPAAPVHHFENNSYAGF